MSDILEKLPKNSSKVSILFQMSGIWKVFWHFLGLTTNLLSSFQAITLNLDFFDPLKKVALVLASFCFLLKYNWLVSLELLVLFNPGEAKRKRSTFNQLRKEYRGYLLPEINFSHSVVSLRSHGLHHARLPCPSPSPGACTQVTTSLKTLVQ